MQIALRKIGNSRGVIIPTAFIEQLQIDRKVDMSIQDGMIVLKPMNNLRQGWFERYDAQQDTDVLADMKALASEEEDWEW